MHSHRLLFSVSATILALTLAGNTLIAQTKKPSKPKSTKSKPTKAPPHETLGTKQMAGGDGVIGTEYTLGKDNPMNIVVSKVEYRADRIAAGDEAITPNSEEKLLAVHFTFHNPQPREALVRGDTFRFTAVDAAGTNHEYDPTIWLEADGKTLDLTLKPGQKVEGYSLIRLPAAGDIEKLMIISSEDKAIRYPLKGKVKPLATLYADPMVKGAFTVGASVAATLGEAIPLAPTGQKSSEYFDFTIEKLALSSKPLMDEAPEEGKQFVILTGRVKNISRTDGLLVRADSLKLALVTTEGESIEHTGRMLHATQGRETEFTFAKGAEGRFRLWFIVYKDAKLKSLSIRHNDNDRPFILDLSKGL